MSDSVISNIKSRNPTGGWDLVKILLASGILLHLLWGCKSSSISSEINQITVSILPQKYFVERIAGNTMKVNVMIPPGHSPATYEPSPQQMKGLSRSKAYLRIGHIPFEKAWMKKISSANPNLKIFDTSTGIKFITSTLHAHEGDHQAEENHDHLHTGIDPHIWLSPKAVQLQAANILQVLTAVYPDKKDAYQKNYQAFLSDINRLDIQIRNLLKGVKQRKFMVFHPAWAYFARDYKLEQLAIELEGKDPNPADLKKIIDMAKSENIKFILVQKQFDTHSAEAIADEIKGEVMQLDPLAEDWLTNMTAIARKLKTILKGSE